MVLEDEEKLDVCGVWERMADESGEEVCVCGWLERVRREECLGCLRDAEQLGDVTVLNEERLEAAVVKVRDEERQPSVGMVGMRQAIPTRPE